MEKSRTTQFYNEYWSAREGWTPHPKLTLLKREVFTRLVTDQTIVLDVGCGDGAHYGKALASIARAYHGLEVSETAVAIAQRNGILAQVHDLSKPFPFADATFDRVICLEVVEHLFDPAFALAEISRVLKPDGCVILAVPNIVHISNRMRGLLGGFSPGGTPETASRRPWADPHIRFFTLRSLRQFVAEQGFRITELYGESFALFSTFPVLSPLAARVIGWNWLERMSQPFEFLARLWPSLLAGNLTAILNRVGNSRIE
jgi:methionine biosynthesis protein MetW